MTKRSLRARIIIDGIIGLLLLVIGAGSFAFYYYDASGPLAEETTILFKRGEGFQAIVDDMGKEGIIRYPLLFKVIAVGLGDARKFKAGEYDFSAGITPHLVMDMIAEGRVVVHKVTVPEGFTVTQVAALLKNEKALEGELQGGIAEGSLLPETYHFTYGDKRQDLISHMQAGMKSTLAELWKNRKKDLPITTPEQAVTLASIVEKETGVDGERGRVASVFINRLRKGMKLQSDPTVTYGLEQKQNGAKLERTLLNSDLKGQTPYNTYVIDGLPPGPIANPGRAALEAVLNPPDTNDLYFVATGSGGHNFSSTLSQHNAYVAQYRKKLKEDK